MKILILSSEFPPQPGGIGHQAASLALWLQRSGKEVRVITNSRGSGQLGLEQTFDKDLPFSVQRARRFRLVWFTYLQRVMKAFRHIDSPDSITVVASGKFSIWLAGFFSFFYPRHRYLAILHGSELTLGGQSQRLTRWCLRGFDKGIAVSEFTAGIVRQIQSRLKVKVIPNGFDPDRLDRHPGRLPLAGKPALITVGNVSFRKGQHNVIRAMPAILERFPEAHYHIVGIPTEQETFEKLAGELGILKQITFHGPLPDAALAPTLRGADLFLMLSERQANGDVEGFGIAILEANHIGLPAIGANDSGIQDAIRNGYSGQLVESNNPLAVYAAVEDILSHYDLYASRAREWAAGFTWDKVIQKYLQLL